MRLATLAACAFAAVLACAAVALSAAAQEKPGDRREKQVREDRTRVEEAGLWIYDDLPRGIAEAKESGKPLLVVLRCVPCEACAKLDEDVVEQDPTVRALLGKFVCVRVPKTNGLDLSLFQFDTDQSWCAFLLNADLTIYGRYGTRSHRTDSDRDVSLEGFGKALEGALALHADFENVRASLAAKRGPKPEYAHPEDLPAYQEKYKASLDWEGKVVPSCIHCHMIGAETRRTLRDAKKPFPETLLFPYPHPTVLGLTMDPKEKARVIAVAPGSTAEKDGFLAGDDLVTLEGQPLLSVADVQWVLHNAPAKGKLAAEVVRDGKRVPLQVTLDEGWRRRGDLSWRVSSWDLRRMLTGGMLLAAAEADLRKAAGVEDGAMALRVNHVGKFGEHAAAKNAGIRVGDLIVAVDGRTDLAAETDLLAFLAGRTKPGDEAVFTVLQDGERREIRLGMR